MDNTQGHQAKSQESRIRTLELQVHTLTQTLAYVMQVTKPIVEIAEEAKRQAERGYIITSGG